MNVCDYNNKVTCRTVAGRQIIIVTPQQTTVYNIIHVGIYSGCVHVSF